MKESQNLQKYPSSEFSALVDALSNLIVLYYLHSEGIVIFNATFCPGSVFIDLPVICYII